MAPMHKVAVLQLHPEPLQLDANFSKAESYIRSAAASGVELVVLPEYYLTSWVPDDAGFVDACKQWKVYLDRYKALAQECRISIVPGTIVEYHDNAEHDSTGLEEGQTEGERLLNVAYFIGPDGQILGKYVKKNLWGSIERQHLTSSNRDLHPVFDTPVGKVGLLICWDLAFPEAFRELIMHGAKTIIIPTFWKLNDTSEVGLAINPVSERLFLDSMLTARCFENTCAIIFANVGGPGQEGYAGASQIAVPFIGPLARLGSSAEGVAVAELDMGILEEAERVYQVRTDLSSPGWHYDYRHKHT